MQLRSVQKMHINKYNIKQWDQPRSTGAQRMGTSVLAKVRKTRRKRRQDFNRTFLKKGWKLAREHCPGKMRKGRRQRGISPIKSHNSLFSSQTGANFQIWNLPTAEVAGSKVKVPAHNHRRDHPVLLPGELWLLAKVTVPGGEGTTSRFQVLRRRSVIVT